MSVYEQYLPLAFPYVVIGRPNDVLDYVQQISEYNKTTNFAGSSFAVTVDLGPDFWCLWLSETSAKELEREFGKSITMYIVGE